MWGGVDLDFRRGLSISVLGIAFLLAAIFFGLLGVMNGPSTGMGVSLIGFLLVVVGFILCLIGAGLISSRPYCPPRT